MLKMKTHVAALVFLFVCANCILSAHTKRFALLVSTTKSWLHYGHQSTLLHAYQTLIANGFPRDNIITMFYDDIANNKMNREPGIIRNHPAGRNVYENVKKDYTGEKVTADSFVGVLTGNATLTQGGPVFKNTGPKDTLFIYVVGLCSYQYLTFPTGPGITAKKLAELLHKLTGEKKFKKVFCQADVSYAAELFEDYLSPKSKVFVIAATGADEHPHAVYCLPEKRTCHGSLYGVAWTQYSDRLRQLKSGAKRTLYDQFNHVRAETPYTSVNMYGDLGVGRSRLAEFISYKHEGRPNRNVASPSSSVSVSVADSDSDSASASADNKVGLATPPHQVRSDDTADSESQSQPQSQPHSINDSYDQLLTAEEKYTAKKNRNFIKETMKTIFERLKSLGYDNIRYEKAEKNHHLLSAHHSDRYEQAIREFHEKCININENPFALREISKLAHLCENGVDLVDLMAAMEQSCTAEHRLTTNVY